MSSHFGRRLFIFDMADSTFEYFLNRNCEIQKDFSNECIFFDCRICHKLIKDFEEKNPGHNLQIELLPNGITPYCYESEKFWHEYCISRSMHYEKVKKEKELPYNPKASVTFDWLESKVRSFWKR